LNKKDKKKDKKDSKEKDKKKDKKDKKEKKEKREKSTSRASNSIVSETSANSPLISKVASKEEKVSEKIEKLSKQLSESSNATNNSLKNSLKTVKPIPIPGNNVQAVTEKLSTNSDIHSIQSKSSNSQKEEKDPPPIPPRPTGEKVVTGLKSLIGKLTETERKSSLEQDIVEDFVDIVDSNSSESEIPQPKSYNPNSFAERFLHETGQLADNIENSHKDSHKNKKMVDLPVKNHHQDKVGFGTLPNQIHQIAIKRGFEFTLMVCGESGLGKSTLLNSLFLTNIYGAEYPGPSKRATKTVDVQESDIDLTEGGVNLRLTVVDTPGYGDNVDNTHAWERISNFVEQKFERYLNDESRVRRSARPSDKRVHACLYFLSPTGHGIRALDIEFMKQLHDKVNIIPVIAKADCMTPEELHQFKKTIMYQIQDNMINIYTFPVIENEKETNKIRSKIPFAVIGSNYVMEGNDGKRVRARQYPWGFAEIENTDHCDFAHLRRMLLQTHMQDLIDVTQNIHYENYRHKKLSPVVYSILPDSASNQDAASTDYDSSIADKNPIEQIEDEKRNHKERMQQMEKEMEQVFQLKVQEKRKRLKDSELELQRRHEQMKKKMEDEWDTLDKRRANFEQEKKRWEEEHKTHLIKMEKNRDTRKKGLF